ncbi:Helix-turn-helix [Arachidicoccus rhizosphaerae]|uniref:Helix-turn-helix n=1 Tax=Arachidicoccus rhizosphaerae TaxID=551991 RepID=A0A1H3XGG3_9BACT|nr:helix-turn-helix transcriptional regulator [Arachidicoccus rhizosphaerae]SDZ98031.1 Helix-turn-helix [Arachidicoccus rhizosphaerae]
MKKTKHNISTWLKGNYNPEIESFIEKNFAITEKVRIAMETKGWKAMDLAIALDKSPSEVSKWLSGMHNFTLKSLVKMEQALGVCLIYTEPIKEYEYIYFGSIKNDEQNNVKATEYEQGLASEVFKIAM